MEGKCEAGAGPARAGTPQSDRAVGEPNLPWTGTGTHVDLALPCRRTVLPRFLLLLRRGVCPAEEEARGILGQRILLRGGLKTFPPECGGVSLPSTEDADQQGISLPQRTGLSAWEKLAMV